MHSGEGAAWRRGCFGLRLEALVCGVSAMTTLPGRVIGTKPAVFCRWVFGLLGAAPR